MRVPYADAMLVPVPAGYEGLASLADNIPDGWRAVAPHLQERAGAQVLVMGGAGPSSVALYAVAVALAMGSAVDYTDHDDGRLGIAESLGAKPTKLNPGEYPKKMGSYPVVVDHTSQPAGLASAIRSTEPGGVCTSTAIYFAPETPLPLLEMYTRGITYITGRVNARACTEPLLRLYEAGNFHPEKVTTQTANWDDAIEALKTYTTKLVISRPPLAL
jgi:alcohol dehydrogenase